MLDEAEITANFEYHDYELTHNNYDVQDCIKKWANTQYTIAAAGDRVEKH